MSETFTRHDAAEYLKTEEDIALYLDACIEEDAGDGRLIRIALGNIARARGIRQLAQEAGMSSEGLCQALSPEGNPEFGTIMKVMRALGVKLHAEVAHV
jgi:probable addiction module antidote protein